MMDMLTMGRRVRPWRTFRIYDPAKRSFDARIGPSGGRRGYTGMTGELYLYLRKFTLKLFFFLRTPKFWTCLVHRWHLGSRDLPTQRTHLHIHRGRRK